MATVAGVLPRYGRRECSSLVRNRSIAFAIDPIPTMWMLIVIAISAKLQDKLAFHALQLCIDKS